MVNHVGERDSDRLKEMYNNGRRYYLLCQSENLPLINSSELGVHLEVLLIQSLRTSIEILINLISKYNIY